MVTSADKRFMEKLIEYAPVCPDCGGKVLKTRIMQIKDFKVTAYRCNKCGKEHEEYG